LERKWLLKSATIYAWHQQWLQIKNDDLSSVNKSGTQHPLLPNSAVSGFGAKNRQELCKSGGDG
jgi:hypothetical protein